MSVEQLYQNYTNNGFVFEDELITRYTLSLYTKPFVILSGISGTGKSKLAQLFKPPIGSYLDESDHEVEESDFISINITDSIINGDGRGNFKFSDLDAVFEEDEIDRVEDKIEEYKAKGVDDNITDTEIIEIVTPEGDVLKASVYLQRAKSPLLRVRFNSKRGADYSFDSRDELSKRFEVGDVLKLQKIGKRKFRIASINDEEVKTKHQKLRQKELKNIENKLFVSVKNNWTDSSEIFGFYNIIEDKYHIPQTLKFILKARENPEIPFFLILDEMNLSKVEHYFSDFLSCVESRIVKDGEIEQEDVILHSKGSYADSDDMYFDLVPSKIEIPTNLYVTGTVNIDESTYMFSPKVLDRANVIEFNEVNLEGYDNGREQQESIKLSEVPSFGTINIATREHFKEAPERLKNKLKELNDILKQYNLHFGYRTVNEISLFAINCLSHIEYDEDKRIEVIDFAIDYQIYQKILPKLHGSYNQLEEPLRKIIANLLNEEVSYENIDSKKIDSIELEEESYPNSIKKLRIMFRNLKTNGFASFLE